MSLVSRLFAKLFARTPAYEESAYGPVYAAVVSRLERPGVRIGKTAGYPRIEDPSITEGAPLDKEGKLRQFTFTVESIGNASLAATNAMNEENVQRLTSELTLPAEWNCLGVVRGQLQDLTETSDTAKIIYRLLQGFTAFVERVKDGEDEDDEPIEEEPFVPADPDEPEPGGAIEEETNE